MAEPQQGENARRCFDAYCKKVLKITARECYRLRKRRWERETVFSQMPESELAGLSATDGYFLDEFVFSVLGESVGIADAALGAALEALPGDKREIVLMSYFFGMTDMEIAKRLGMARRTVSHRKNGTLQELRKSMESGE